VKLKPLLLANLLFFMGGVASAQALSTDTGSVRVAVRGVGEVWQDNSISQIYRGSTFLLGIGIVVPLHKYVVLDIEGSFKRLAGVEVGALTSERSAVASAFETVPFAFDLEGRVPLQAGELFFGVGPSVTVFTEEHSPRLDTGLVTTEGVKIGMDTRLGLRFETNLVQPSLAPGNQSAIRGVDVEFWMGRRWQFGQVGFDLSAWRGGAGLMFRM
jgi:hypothetical protein